MPGGGYTHPAEMLKHLETDPPHLIDWCKAQQRLDLLRTGHHCDTAARVFLRCPACELRQGLGRGDTHAHRNAHQTLHLSLYHPATISQRAGYASDVEEALVYRVDFLPWRKILGGGHHPG